MDLQELRRLVKQGEGSKLEFKRKANFPEKIARELVAFANTEGGMLLLGVEDDGEIYGCKHPEEELYVIETYVLKHCHPRLPVKMERIAISAQREVICYHVSPSRRKPFFLRDAAGTQTAFVRVNDMSITASREMVAILRFAHTNKGVNIQFGDQDRRLLSAIESEPGLGFGDLGEKLSLGRRKLSERIVLLARAGLVKIQPTERGDRFHPSV